MDAHGVFDPNKTSAERQAAWVPVATDVNRWAEQAEGVVCADRSALACQTQWRKTVYKKLKEGMRMSEIATGPSEKTDEEWQPILAGLAELWEEQCSADSARKEERNVECKGEKEHGRSRQQEATDELGELDEIDDEEDGDGDTSDTRRKSFVAEQGRSARAERAARGEQHESAMAEAREAREEQQRQHRENARREDRRLELEEQRVHKETETAQQLQRLEQGQSELRDMLVRALQNK
ncbi:hypothetical protein V8E36_000518 [Tilletia maclaganii]